MKLAEALIIRADIQKRIEQLKKRLGNVVKIQEGDTPAEDPFLLIKEISDLYLNLENIIKQINKTNSLIKLDNEKTIAEVLAERDIIVSKRNFIINLIESASVRQDRYSHSEIKFKITIDINSLQKEADVLAKKYREIDTKIQQLNWNIELLD